MPAVQRSEFLLALNQVAHERGVDISVVLDTVGNAILAAYKKDHPRIDIKDYSTTLDKNTGEAKIQFKDKDVTPPGFGRIAAQTARQVILQKIREKEKEAIIAHYKLRIGTVTNGMVLRFAGPNVIIDIGKAEAIMPNEEQILNEKYRLNQRLTVYIAEIREGVREQEIIVSRASKELLIGLFKREVPEIAKGSVIIKDVARQAGVRSKIAVYSTQKGIDPVGSCVGQKGVRVQAVIQEFGGLEKIDIIQWFDAPKDYITQALSPAKNVRVDVDTEKKVAHIFVPEEELSLAIGKEGQNVRLASKLTGYRIEIEGEKMISKETKAAEENLEEKKETETETVEAKEDKGTSEAQPSAQVSATSQKKQHKSNKEEKKK